MSQQPPVPNEPQDWHLSKKIGLSHIIATASLTVVLLGMALNNEKRMNTLEVTQRHILESRALYEGRTEKKFDELKTDLRLINQKLDRLIRNGGGND